MIGPNNVSPEPLVRGKLVTVQPLEYKYKAVVEKHGKLWMVTGDIMADGFVWCRSLATGFDFDWHTHDLFTYEELHPTTSSMEG